MNKYVLEYYDTDFRKTVILPMEAQTDLAAKKKVKKILQDKRHLNPGLYDAVEYQIENQMTIFDMMGVSWDE